MKLTTKIMTLAIAMSFSMTGCDDNNSSSADNSPPISVQILYPESAEDIDNDTEVPLYILYDGVEQTPQCSITIYMTDVNQRYYRMMPDGSLWKREINVNHAYNGAIRQYGTMTPGYLKDVDLETQYFPDQVTFIAEIKDVNNSNNVWYVYADGYYY